MRVESTGIAQPARRAMGRWTRDDWIELAVDRLKAGGAQDVTLEALCVAAGRTRGSFYHHFPTVSALMTAMAERWRRTETDEIARIALAEPDPREGLRALARRSAQMDHGLEIGVRALATDHPELRQPIREADEAREAIIAGLLARAYALAPEEASDVARLFHSLQLAAQMRAPEDVAGFSAASARRMTAWLEARAAGGS